LNVYFTCPSCDRPAQVGVRTSTDWQCPACDHRQQIDAAEPTLPCCVICGNPELYKKKDFPHWLGMTILVVACVASAYTYLWYDKWLTWAILIGSAIIDGALYLSVGDAVVCYRCNAHYKGFTPTEAHRPFELTIGERYRQERLRVQERQRNTQNRTRPSEPM
jgi:hypothetical protein